MTDFLKVPKPTQYDLDGGSSIAATVAEVEDDMIAIVVDRRDAAHISIALQAMSFANRDDQEAAQKLAELIESLPA